MKFIIDTSKLINAVSLAIISSNVNRFDYKSSLVQLTANPETNILTINLDANYTYTEVRLSGECVCESDEDANTKKFIDVTMFKQLVCSFDSKVTEIEFIDSGIVLYSGTSKFNLPQIIDGEDMSLTSPDNIGSEDEEIEFNKSDWEFIKNNQFYALAKDFVHPIYTYVYIGNGNTITGNMNESLFTLSHRLDLGDTVSLLSDKNIISGSMLPDNTKFAKHGESFIFYTETNDFIYTMQFLPKYEGKSDLGYYNADIILDLMKIPEDGYCSIETSSVKKFISQISILSQKNEDYLQFEIKDNKLKMIYKNNNINIISIGGNCTDFKLNFMLSNVKNAINNYSSDEIHISPVYNNDNVMAGMLIWDDNLTTIVTAVED